MSIEQEWVCGNLKHSAEKTQIKHDTLMDTWQINTLLSSERFLNFRHAVLLLGVRERLELSNPKQGVRLQL